MDIIFIMAGFVLARIGYDLLIWIERVKFNDLFRRPRFLRSLHGIVLAYILSIAIFLLGIILIIKYSLAIGLIVFLLALTLYLLQRRKYRLVKVVKNLCELLTKCRDEFSDLDPISLTQTALSIRYNKEYPTPESTESILFIQGLIEGKEPPTANTFVRFCLWKEQNPEYMRSFNLKADDENFGKVSRTIDDIVMSYGLAEVNNSELEDVVKYAFEKYLTVSKFGKK